MIDRVLLVAVLLGCDPEAAAPRPDPLQEPGPVAVAAPQAAPPHTARGADIRVAGTTRGGEVLAIGRPRLRVSPDAGIGIAASAGRVFATDREAIAVWNLSDGTLLGRYHLAAEPGLPALTVSPDGAFVTARGNLIAIAKGGAMTLAAVLGGVAHRFSGDGVQLAMAWETPVIVDVATRRVVLTSPALATFSPTLDLDRAHWLRGDGVYAWFHARNAWMRLLEAKAPWRFGQLASRAQVAIVVDKAGISRVDLVTRRSTRRICR